MEIDDLNWYAGFQSFFIQILAFILWSKDLSCTSRQTTFVRLSQSNIDLMHRADWWGNYIREEIDWLQVLAGFLVLRKSYPIIISVINQWVDKKNC